MALFARAAEVRPPVARDLEAAPTGPTATEAVRYVENPRRTREDFAPDFHFVSLDGDEGEWRAAIADGKMTWTQTLDRSGELRRLFGIRPIPTAVVIAGEGIVRGRIFGYSPSYGGTLDSDVRDRLKRLAAPPAR